MNKSLISSKFFIALLLFLATVLVFLGTLKNGFINWDDNVYIYDNPLIKSLSFDTLYRMFSQTHAGYWIPLTWLSLALDYALFRIHPWGYHLTNVLLHGINAVLLFILIVKALPLFIDPKTKTDPLFILFSAMISTLFWAIHPMRVESVAWATERKDVLAMGFILGMTLTYLHFLQTKRISLYFTAVGLYLLSLMSKPLGLTAPFILLIFDRQYGLTRRHFLTKIPFLMIAGISAFLTIEGTPLTLLNHISLWQRALNALHSVIFYLEKSLWPTNLVGLYPFEQLVSLQNPLFVLSLALFTALTILTLWLMKKGLSGPLKAFGAYLLLLLPAIGFIHAGQQAAADRFTYLAILPWIFGIAFLIHLYLKKRKPFLPLLGLVSVLLIALSITTVVQIPIWNNTLVFWESIISAFPNRNPVAYNNYGLELQNQGFFEEAKKQHLVAIELDPEFSQAYLNVGLIFQRHQQYDEALPYYLKAIQLNPHLQEGYNNLGLLSQFKGKKEEAITYFNHAISCNPYFVYAYLNLGYLYTMDNNIPLAKSYYQKALSLDPDVPEIHFNLGVISYIEGHIQEAIKHYQKSIELRPHFYQAYTNLGMIYSQQGAFQEAADTLRKALVSNPQFIPAQNNLRTLLLTHPNL